MATKSVDARGLRCPQPQLKLVKESHSMAKGDIIEVVAHCETFEADVRNWCQRANKALLWFRTEGGGAKRCQVRL